MNYRIQFEKKALQDIKKITLSGIKSDIAKLDNMLEELKKHPQTGVGNPEQLKHILSGLWSRRLNKKDRLIMRFLKNQTI